MTSRHRRPKEPLPFQLTTRDKDVLTSVYRHRFLSAAHVRSLHFDGAGARVCQARLQRLWSAQFVDRLYMPPEAPGVRDRWAGVPLYSLARRGAEQVAADIDLNVADIPHTPAQNREGFSRMRHNLVVTDLLVALHGVSRAAKLKVAPVREDTLRRMLHAARQRGQAANALVPDGAVTITAPTLAVPQTYIIEIVRAPVKAGNTTIQRRLFRYRAALKSGFFRIVYGFAWVRAVVFLTPTTRRTKHLALLAKNIIGGEHLFRFGAYEHRVGEATPTSTLTPSALEAPCLLAPSGKRVPFLQFPSNLSQLQTNV